MCKLFMQNILSRDISSSKFLGGWKFSPRIYAIDSLVWTAGLLLSSRDPLNKVNNWWSKKLYIFHFSYRIWTFSSYELIRRKITIFLPYNLDIFFEWAARKKNYNFFHYLEIIKSSNELKVNGVSLIWTLSTNELLGRKIQFFPISLFGHSHMLHCFTWTFSSNELMRRKIKVVYIFGHSLRMSWSEEK